jgi:hypothetical protein
MNAGRNKSPLKVTADSPLLTGDFEAGRITSTSALTHLKGVGVLDSQGFSLCGLGRINYSGLSRQQLLCSRCIDKRKVMEWVMREPA